MNEKISNNCRSVSPAKIQRNCLGIPACFARLPCAIGFIRAVADIGRAH